MKTRIVPASELSSSTLLAKDYIDVSGYNVDALLSKILGLCTKFKEECAPLSVAIKVTPAVAAAEALVLELEELHRYLSLGGKLPAIWDKGKAQDGSR